MHCLKELPTGVVLDALRRQEEPSVLCEEELCLRVGINHEEDVRWDVGPQRKVDKVEAFLHRLHRLLFPSVLKANGEEAELGGELFESAIRPWTEPLMFSGAAR